MMQPASPGLLGREWMMWNCVSVSTSGLSETELKHIISWLPGTFCATLFSFIATPGGEASGLTSQIWQPRLLFQELSEMLGACKP